MTTNELSDTIKESIQQAIRKAYEQGLEDGAFLEKRKQQKDVIRGHQTNDAQRAINAGVFDAYTLSNIYLQQHERDKPNQG